MRTISDHNAPRCAAPASKRNWASLMEPLEQRMLFTVLTFDSATTAFANYGVLPQAYGDRVTAAVQGGFKYGTAGGTTPNVVAQYGTTSATIETWDTNYGDLKNVIFSSPSGSIFQMTLAADSGFKVSLASFDMAGYSQTNYTINNVKVTDGTGKALFSQNSVLIKGAGPTHTHFTFSSAVSAPVLKISFDSSNQGGYNVGIDNIQFSQARIGPPPPGPGTVSGVVFNDVNGNGKQDVADKALAGWRVYVDTNNNGMFDAGETSVLTDANGKFTLNLPAGTYEVSVQLKRGYYQTAPHTLVYDITINSNKLTGELFGVKLISPA